MRGMFRYSSLLKSSQIFQENMFLKLVRLQQMNNGHNLPLICRHNHQHNLSTGLTAEEIAKLPPRRHRNVKTVGNHLYAVPA